MKITLNGQDRETISRTVAELLRELEAPSQGVAVAVNERVIRRAEHEQELCEGDKVELIRAVQGG